MKVSKPHFKSFLATFLSATIIFTSIAPSYADKNINNYKAKLKIEGNLDIKDKSILNPNVNVSYDEKQDKTTYKVTFDNSAEKDKVKRYKIKGSIKNYSDESQDSMASAALNPDVVVIHNESENKTIYELKFKPIEITLGNNKLKDGIQELYLYETDNKSNKIQIQSIPINEGQYNQKFVIEKAGDIQNKLTLGFKVKAMGDRVLSALLVLDIDSKIEDNQAPMPNNPDGIEILQGKSKKYQIQGSIKDFSNQSQDSMANKALNPNVIASYDKDTDKAIYELRFKPIEIVINGQSFKDSIKEFYIFDSLDSNQSKQIHSQRISEDGYEQKFVIERQGGIQSKLLIGVKVNAMGDLLRKAVLVLDFNTKKEILSIVEEDDSNKIALEQDQTLKYKDREKIGDNYVLNFENTLPKDYKVELKSVSYGIYNESLQKEKNKIQGAILSQDGTRLTVPSNIKPGHYYVNIFDANGKYQSPKVKFDDSKPLSPLNYTRKPLYPYFVITAQNNWTFHNGKLIPKGNVTLQEIVDRLNNNISEIELTTLGFSIKEEFYPNDKNGLVSWKEGANKLFNDDGSLNLDYTAGTGAIDKQGENTPVFKNLDRFDQKNGKLKWIRIKFWGEQAEPYTGYDQFYIALDTEKPLTPPKEDKSYIDINGTGRFGYEVFLKLKFEEDNATIKEIIDNDTSSRTGGANANVWESFISSGGLKKYAGKRLEDVKEMKMEPGADAVSGATGSSKDVKDIVIKFLEKHYKENNINSGVNKRELIDLLEQGKDILQGIKNSEYQSGADEYNQAYQEATKIREDNSATKQQVEDAISKLKAARDKLVLKPVSKEKLESAIQQADSKDKKLYDIETLPVFEKALEKAKTVKNTEKIRQIHIDNATKELNDSMSNLVEKNTKTAKTYNITGKIVAADGSGDSMASPALNQEVTIREENGKTRFYLRFRPINVQNVQAEIEDLKHIEGTQEKSTRNSRIDGEYSKLFVFERNTTREKQFDIKIGARMGSPELSYPKATLILDYSSIKEDKDEIKEPDLTEEEIDKKYPGDRPRLKNTIKGYMQIRQEAYQGLYQDEVSNKFKEKYNEALKILRDDKLPNEDGRVWDVVGELNKTVYDLRVKNKPNVEKLDEIIAKSEEIIQNKEKYEETGFAEFEKYFKGIYTSNTNLYLETVALEYGAKKLRESSDLYIVRQSIIDKYVEELNKKISALKQKDQKDQEDIQKYNIQVSLQHYYETDKTSMGNGALNPNAVVTHNKKENKTVYQLQFKPLTLTTQPQLIQDSVYELYLYETDKNSKPQKIELKDISIGEYTKQATFERIGDIEKEIVLGFKVKAMPSEQQARLRLDLDNKQQIASNIQNPKFKTLTATSSYVSVARRLSSKTMELVSKFWYIESGQEKEAQKININGKNTFIFTKDGKPKANLFVKLYLPKENKEVIAEMSIEGLKEETKKPIESYDKQTKDTGIQITQNIKDALEEGTKIQAKEVKETDKEHKQIQEKAKTLIDKVTKGEIKLDESTQEKLKNSVIKKIVAFDISLKKDGQKAKVKEGKSVELSIPIPKDFNKDQVVAMHIKDSGEIEVIRGTVVGDSYQMEVTSFSHYILAQLEKSNSAPQAPQNSYTKVKIFIRNASEDDQLSMSDKAVRREMDVEEKDGKATYKIYFKPMEIEFGGQRLTGNVTNFYVYGDSGREEIYKSSTDGEYSVYEFTRNKLREEQIRIAVTVDAMALINPNAATKDAIIELDWNNSKVAPAGGGNPGSYLDPIEHYDDESKETGIQIRPKTKDSLDEKVKVQAKSVKQTDKKYAEINEKITNLLEKIAKGETKLDKELQEKVKDTKLVKFVAFDITLKKDGEKAKVKEGKTVELSIPIPKDFDKEKLFAMHLKENGELQIVKGKVSGEKYEMEVSEFSHYILAELETVKKQELLKTQIKEDLKLGYVSGYKDGTFKPNANITRGELAFIVAQLINDDKIQGVVKFKDVDKDSWNANAISKLATLGIISGYEDGTFKPNKHITRAEYASIIARYKNITSDKNEFTDTKGHWATKSINACKENGYISGYKDGTFKPQNNLTRAEAVVITNKVFDIKASETVQKQIDSKEMPFSDVKPTDWFYKDIMIAK